jgi:hypothetical protein
MSQQQELRPIAERVYAGIAQVMQTEAERGTREGVPIETFLDGALNALVRTSAYFACHKISPESDPTSERVQARIHRLRVALSQALHRIMESELRAMDIKGHA